MRTLWSYGVALTSLTAMGCLPPLPEFNLDSASSDGYSVSIDPETPSSQDVVQAIVAGSPAPSGEFVNALTYEWTVNGEVRGGNERTLIGAKYFQRGDEIQVSVSDFPNGEPDIQSEPISIINAQPTPPLLMLDWLNRCGSLFFNENTTVQMPQYSMLGFDDSMTIEMWVTYQGNVNGDTNQFLIGQGNDTDIAFRLMLTADGLFELFTHDGRQFSSSVELPLQNGEHHVALVYQHPTWQLYLDGILVLNNTSTGDPLPDSDEMPLFIGAAGSGQEFSRFNGGFHSIRASHQARYTQPFFDLLDTLIFRPQMDDAALWYFAPAPSDGDFTVPDLSGNGNNLEVSAGTWHESCPIPIFDLRCLIEEESDDIDNDPLTYGFSWTLDDEPLETASFQYPMAEEIYQEHLIGVETVTCKVLASDGQPSENSQSEPAEVQMSLQQQ